MLSSYRSKLLNTLKKLLDMDKLIASVGNRRTPKSREIALLSGVSPGQYLIYLRETTYVRLSPIESTKHSRSTGVLFTYKKYKNPGSRLSKIREAAAWGLFIQQ